MLGEKRNAEWYRKAAEIEEEFPFFSVGPPHMLRSLTVLEALEKAEARKKASKSKSSGGMASKGGKGASES